VLTLLDYRSLSAGGTNDIQVILHTDTGDVQVSYRDSTFDLSAGRHWSIGVSQPDVGMGRFSGFDFVEAASPFRQLQTFGPGAVGQWPEHDGTSSFVDLNGHGILFHNISTGGWQILVDRISGTPPP
jgi:hypothetical protein